MRLPPDPISAANSAPRRMQTVSRNPFRARARRALLEADHAPARLQEPPSADRDVPPPARDTCGAWSGVSPYRPPPPTGHSAPPADRRFHSIQAAHSAPHRPEVPFHAGRTIPPRADRMFHPLSAGHAPHGGSLPCAGTGTKKRDGSPLSTQGLAQKNGTAAHTRPRKGNRIS